MTEALELAAWLAALDLPEAQRQVADLVLTEAEDRLAFLLDVGLGYLSLDRQTRTLSGGEAQRIALSNALGARLVDALYVLDEPSIGLHPRDTDRLLAVLRQYRPNAIMHFAAYCYVGESVTNPLEYYRNNVGGTLSLLAAMRDAEVDRLVVSSTCAVYGVPDSGGLIDEERPRRQQHHQADREHRRRLRLRDAPPRRAAPLPGPGRHGAVAAAVPGQPSVAL